jgi:hypothetical protein
MRPEQVDLITRLGHDLSQKVVVNLGAGRCDSPVSLHFRNLYCKKLINVEVHQPYFEVLRKITFLSHAENLMQSLESWVLTAPDDSVDIIVMIDVLEHLRKEEARRLWMKMARVARDRIVVWLPFGDCPQDALDGNPYQRHQSTWVPSDFEHKSFQVEVYPGFHLHFNPPVDAGWVIQDVTNRGDGHENPFFVLEWVADRADSA